MHIGLGGMTFLMLLGFALYNFPKTTFSIIGFLSFSFIAMQFVK